MARPIDPERIRRPELVLGDMLRTYAQGGFASADEASKVIYRAVVLAVDIEGGMLSGPSVGPGSVDGIGVDGRQRAYSRVVGPLNPRGSVKAIVIDAARDSFYDEDAARILWPFFPVDQMTLPISPGEHVYSLFEDPLMEHGLWVCRVSGHDSPNVMPGSEHFSAADTGRRRLQRLFDPGVSDDTEQRTSDDVSTRVRPSRRRLAGLF